MVFCLATRPVAESRLLLLLMLLYSLSQLSSDLFSFNVFLKFCNTNLVLVVNLVKQIPQKQFSFSCPMCSFRDSILTLTEHNDKQVLAENIIDEHFTYALHVGFLTFDACCQYSVLFWFKKKHMDPLHCWVVHIVFIVWFYISFKIKKCH